MADRFQHSSPSLSGPAAHAFAVTPNDSADLVETTRALYVGATGSVAAVMASGSTVTFAAIQAGTTLPVRVTRVLATGTTASAVVGLV